MALYIDITELESWQGKLTGVPRVMNELAMRYADDSSVTFVKWDGLSRRYFPTSLPSLREESAPSALPVAPSLVKRVARKIVVSNPVTLGLFQKAKHYKYRRQQSSVPMVNEPKVSLQAGDVLFVLADWHGSDRNFVDELISLHEQGVKLVQISYDLLPVVTPQYSGHSTETLKYYIENIYPLCDLIIAISEHTKRDVIQWLKGRKLTVPNIEVMRLGDDFKRSTPKKPDVPELNKGEEFLVCVGTIEARKNHTLLYYTYKLAQQRGVTLPKLIVAGRRGWRSEDIVEIIRTDPEVKDSIILLENRTDEELAWLYQNSRFSVYPSFYEGWGLPIAESIAYGTPCIASNTSSMPEIAGSLIDYFSPASTDECLARITDLMDNKNLDKARKKIKKYKPISWDASFVEVEKYIRKVSKSA